MKDGFIRVAAATPDIKVADPVYNAEQYVNVFSQIENDIELFLSTNEHIASLKTG